MMHCPHVQDVNKHLSKIPFSVQLQDRTQFSDGDLYALKRYWDNGMTSLGSVCKEKIAAAAIELSVDSEIIKVCRLPLTFFSSPLFH